MSIFDYDKQADKYIRQDRQLRVATICPTFVCFCGNQLIIPTEEGKQDIPCECGEVWQVYNSSEVFDGRPRSKKKESKK